MWIASDVRKSSTYFWFNRRGYCFPSRFLQNCLRGSCIEMRARKLWLEGNKNSVLVVGKGVKWGFSWNRGRDSVVQSCDWTLPSFSVTGYVTVINDAPLLITHSIPWDSVTALSIVPGKNHIGYINFLPLYLCF